MNPLQRKLAVVGIIWAVVLPPLFFLPHVTGWPVMDLRMASYVLRHSYASDSITNGFASVSTNSLNSSVGIIKDLEVSESRHLKIFDGVFILATSVILIVMSACVLKAGKKDEHKTV